MDDAQVPLPQAVENPALSASSPPPPKGRRGLWFFVVCVLIAGGGYFLNTRFALFGAKSGPAETKSGPRPIPVVTATAEKGDLNVYLTSLGTVTAYNSVTVKSRVDGELIELGFKEGDFVKEGSLLAQIDPRPYEVQLAQYQGQLSKDEATLKDAQLNLERVRKLVAAKAVTAQQLDTAQAAVDQLEGALVSDKAQIDNAKLQLTYCKITAPISGRIGLRRVDKGNLIHASDANGIAVITQLQPIAVLFTIPQDEIVRVQKNDNPQQRLTVDAYNRDLATKLATGSLEAIDNQVDPATGTIRLKAVFKNEDMSLFPNQFVNVRLLVDTVKDAVLVPMAAVQQGPNFTFTYVVKSDETVELRTIVAGPSEGDLVAIASGLTAGEVVVTEGVDKLQDGSHVTTQAKPGQGSPSSGAPETRQAENPAGKTGS